MTHRYYLGDHTPVLHGPLESSVNTIELARDAARRLHTEKCCLSDCDYDAKVAWVVDEDGRRLEIDLEDFYGSTIPAHRVAIRASITDVFPSDSTSQLVFTSREEPLFPWTMTRRPCPSTSFFSSSKDVAPTSLKRKTPDDEPKDNSSGNIPSSPLSLASMSSTDYEPSHKRCKTVTFGPVHGSVFCHSGADHQCLPSTRSDFEDIVHSHCLYVDKSQIVPFIDEWSMDRNQIPVIRRPHGYGLRTFASMIEALLSHSKDYEMFFDGLDITTKHRWHPSLCYDGRNDMLVLRLDLADSSLFKDDFSKSFRRYIENRIAGLYQSAGEVIQRHCRWLAWRSAVSPGLAIMSLAKQLHSSGSPPLYVIVENATAPLKAEVVDASKVLRRFFSDLAFHHATTYAGVVVTDYLDHMDPSSTEALPSIFPQRRGAYIDATAHPVVQQCFGFTRNDVEDLVAATHHFTLPDMPDIWEMLQLKGVKERLWASKDNEWDDWDGGCVPPVFSMEEVLQTLAVRCGQENQRSPKV